MPLAVTVRLSFLSFLQDKLDRLFDRGHVSKSELDDYTLDSLKGKP